VDHARNIFDGFADKQVLSLGAGKMSALVLRRFAELRPKKLLVCNRSFEKAQSLANEFGGEAVPFEKLEDHLSQVDIVLSGTGSQLPIITRNLFNTVHRRRRYRPIFLIDIALPRDIEPAVAELENVYLYNLDDLQQVVSKTRALRKDALAAAEKLVDAAVVEYSRSHRARELGPTIDKLYKRSHALASEELARALQKLPNISEAERLHLEDLTRRIVNKLLHDPIHALRNGDDVHATSSQYLHALERLFRLGEERAGEEDESEAK
jgi:glutamyl-tRNA reductase